ncbi:hypothetical protein BLA13014_01497 [Burkholderia aenigmatica]|uniref:Uncharacterized protein n=1 Tax=Burkholderia aenigmatica TaxID=2015348 RepID=A0A6P2J3C6_9BURK|nr:hypothetical protein BLA13014_01497 [Burkholderia aenigmatica]
MATVALIGAGCVIPLVLTHSLESIFAQHTSVVLEFLLFTEKANLLKVSTIFHLCRR